MSQNCSLFALLKISPQQNDQKLWVQCKKMQLENFKAKYHEQINNHYLKSLKITS